MSSLIRNCTCQKPNKHTQSLCKPCLAYWESEAWKVEVNAREIPFSPEVVDRYLQVEDPDPFEIRAGEPDIDFSWLERYLDKLSPRQRQVIELRFWLDRTFSEIAEELEISKSSVQIHMATGLQRIKSLILKRPHTTCTRIYEGEVSFA